jgi:hypothetical protein
MGNFIWAKLSLNSKGSTNIWIGNVVRISVVVCSFTKLVSLSLISKGFGFWLNHRCSIYRVGELVFLPTCAERVWGPLSFFVYHGSFSVCKVVGAWSLPLHLTPRSRMCWDLKDNRYRFLWLWWNMWGYSSNENAEESGRRVQSIGRTDRLHNYHSAKCLLKSWKGRSKL